MNKPNRHEIRRTAEFLVVRSFLFHPDDLSKPPMRVNPQFNHPPLATGESHITRFTYRLVAVATIWACIAGAVAQEPDRLDRHNLLFYQDTRGALRPIKTKEDWQLRRAQILRAMEVVMGEFPGDDRRVAPDVKVREEFDAGTYLRRLITYQSEPGSRTTAYLCIPKDVLAGTRSAPAVLCLHPTDRKVGHKVALGLGERQGRAYGAELAERGYITLAPSYPNLADYWPPLDRLGYVSGTMKAIWDNSRGLDLLDTLPYVLRTHGYGAIGHSLGGHNAIYTAAFEQRITVLASSCGFDSYLDYKGGKEINWRFGRGWCQIRYMPRMSDYRGNLEAIPFDFHELLAALAPRPLFVNAPLHDGNFHWQSVDRCVSAAQPVYKLFESDGNLVVSHPDCAHDFPVAMREQAYSLIDSVLRPDAP
ncbi:MAG: alpha/beta hydrolase [Planctomycetaceae bacterium]|nr:alpha/beta hydrolase [Planctomycetaceae bacterium]